jgi:hypothetical protein
MPQALRVFDAPLVLPHLRLQEHMIPHNRVMMGTIQAYHDPTWYARKNEVEQ